MGLRQSGSGSTPQEVSLVAVVQGRGVWPGAASGCGSVFLSMQSLSTHLPAKSQLAEAPCPSSYCMMALVSLLRRLQSPTPQSSPSHACLLQHDTTQQPLQVHSRRQRSLKASSYRQSSRGPSDLCMPAHCPLAFHRASPYSFLLVHRP